MWILYVFRDLCVFVKKCHFGGRVALCQDFGCILIIYNKYYYNRLSEYAHAFSYRDTSFPVSVDPPPRSPAPVVRTPKPNFCLLPISRSSLDSIASGTSTPTFRSVAASRAALPAPANPRSWCTQAWASRVLSDQAPKTRKTRKASSG